MTEPEVIYQDNSIIVINKPAGLPVHETMRATTATVASFILEHFPELSSVGEPQQLQDGSFAARPGIVHRLDTETSGIMLLARSEAAYVSLRRQFAHRTIQKTYRAFVYGRVQQERLLINRPLGRTAGSGSRRTVKDPRGALRDAQTLIRRIESKSHASYLEVFPKTGRTHQIRVHLASIDHPVICDSLYAPSREPLLEFTRLALHALALTFMHPKTREKMSLEAPLPQEFLRAEEKLRAL